MSRLLEQAARLDPQRAEDLIADKAAEAARIQADPLYLAQRAQRERERIAEVADMEQRLGRLRGLGAL